MKSWQHLVKNGEAESVPVEIQEHMFDAMFHMFRSMQPKMYDELVLDIRDRCEVVRFKKKSIIIDYGETCRHVFFAGQGLVRALFLRDGMDQTCWFMGEQDIVIAVESFYAQQPSKERLVALEDTDCIALHWDDLQFIYDKHESFNRIGRLLTEFYYRQAIERTKWVCLSAKERYQKLFEDYPKFIGRVPDVYLASYLGIDKATLSRIRSTVYKEN